ncbi:MAG: transporter [Methylococcales bacterium]|nr:transporter [Methylococcales bacterium]
MNSKKMSNRLLIFYARIFSLTIMLVVTGMSYAVDHSSNSEKFSVNLIRNNKQQKLQALRLGVYQTRIEADKVVIKLRQLGFDTRIKQLNHGYIVNAGAFSSVLNFDRALNRLKKAGLGDNVIVVKVNKGVTPTKFIKTRSTVFTPHTSGTQDKSGMDKYVPKEHYVKLEQEVEALKAQMLSLLETLALPEQDLNAEMRVKENEKERKPKPQMWAKESQGEESKPAKVKTNKNNERIEGKEEANREEEAKEAKRGLDTFLRGKKVLYKPGELQLEFNLAYGLDTAVNTFGFSPATTATSSNAKSTTRSVNSSLTMRYGVFDDLEFTFSVPYGYFEQDSDNQPFNKVVKPECKKDQVSSDASQCTTPGGGEEFVETAPVSHTNILGVGDISGTLSYNVLSEKGNIPSVSLSLSGQAPTGNYNRGLGSGFWGVGGNLSLVKTIDPVVFFGSLGYFSTFEERGIDLSDQVSYSIGAGYSMNDRVSFSTALSGRFSGRKKEDGIERPGSSVDTHSLQFNTTIQLTKRLSVEPYVGFGVTKDASDFVVGLSFPYRFGDKFPLPFLSN